jgi:hypothetical protein
MKPNGKHFAAFLVFCAITLISGCMEAQTARGTFKLAVETRWNQLALAPGEYEFSVNNDGAINMVTVRSMESGRSGMILSVSTAEAALSDRTRLSLSKSDEGTYVQALILGDSGLVLNYAAPGSEKAVRLVKSQKVTTAASASGGH